MSEQIGPVAGGGGVSHGSGSIGGGGRGGFVFGGLWGHGANRGGAEGRAGGATGAPAGAFAGFFFGGPFTGGGHGQGRDHVSLSSEARQGGQRSERQSGEGLAAAMHRNYAPPAQSGQAGRESSNGAQRAPDVRPLDGGASGGSALWNSVKNGRSISNISSFGSSLAQNKQSLMKGLDQAGADAETKKMVMSVAMQETQHMSVGERDNKKDGDAKSKNFSALNINGDMIDQLYGKNGGTLKNVLNGRDNDASLKAAAKVMTDATKRWGKDKTLMFLRQGSAPFVGNKADNALKGGAFNGTAKEYFTNVGRISSTLSQNPALMTNDKRINIGTSYI